MDEQILRTEHGNMAGPVALYLVMATLAVFLIAQGVLGLGGTLSTVPFAVGGIVLVLLVGLLTIIVERPSPPVSRGPRAIGQVHTTAPPQIVFAHLQPLTASVGFRPEEWLGTTLRLGKSVNMLSWGTKLYIDVRASMDRPGWGVVTVLSRPTAPFQLSDGGRARRPSVGCSH